MKRIKHWQKAGAIIALFAVLVPVWYAIDFIVERASHQWEMHERMESALLETIILDSATIMWEDKGRELIVNNEYFDVSTIRFENGKAIISGVFDQRETEMQDAFAKAQEQNTTNNSGPRIMAQWLMKHWLQTSNHFTCCVVICAINNPASKVCTMHSRFAASPALPPPRIG